ncbi:aminotransferase, class V family protein [Catenaria anguillulae PL171]|uniref:alanine--glyoxylate transaminase n=1 Tax=Catenaria anguillulae PL171 TaxID=765915 RepID=A0A1Y2I012_9FUNG|nr:aminotransferase, class V family protein [Catenaria anguillulae PL171]
MAAPHKLCMIPGPVEFHQDVLDAMATKATSHIDPNFIKTFGESLVMLKQVLMCKNGQPFIISGSGTLGWDMVAANLVEPSETALVVNTGLFGDRFGECIETYGGKVTHLHADAIGLAPTLESIAQAIKAAPTPFKIVTITHVDTSTGVLTDIKSIARLVKEASPSTLVIVDAVCSAGAEEIDMDGWGIDVVLTASQKALGTPPGLALLVASERAMQVFQARKSPPSSYFGSFAKWVPIMQAYMANKPSYFATPAVQLIISLHTSLRQILSRPLAERFEQHIKVSDDVKKVVTSWGLKLVPGSHALAAHTLTAVYYPEGVTAQGVLSSIAGKGVIIAGGLHPKIAPTYMRIGHMGLSVTAENEHNYVKTTLAALEAALRENGYTIPNQ